MNSISNVSSYGADMLHYAGLKGEQDSGPLYFALAYHQTLVDLSAKIDHAMANNDKLRPIVLDHWKATPEGEEVQKEYATLLAIKAKTADQTVRQQALLELFNQVNTQTLRNVDTCKGIDMLRADNRQVNIQRIPGTSKYACYVVSLAKNADGTQAEFINVPFTATQLRKLATVKVADIAGKSTADVRKMVDSLKNGAPNASKGGTEAIARTELGKVAKALEASIAGTFDKDGKLDGVSQATRNDVYMLWASMDASMSDTEKAKARAAYAELSKVEAPKAKVSGKGKGKVAA
jgi:hypothetical protein